MLEKQHDLKRLLLRSNKSDLCRRGHHRISFFTVPRPRRAKLSQWLHSLIASLTVWKDLPVPTLAAVNGYALGGGCEITTQPPITVWRRQTSSIGLPETKLGIMPGFGSSVRLRICWARTARWKIIAAGKDVGAEHALKIGLVDGVVKQKKLVKAR